jgi:hypothetical protein
VLETHNVFSGTIRESPDACGHVAGWSNVDKQGTRVWGACWLGETAYVDHVVNHTNPGLKPISGQHEMMTLADAVDYTKFLVSFTCDFQRFAIMVPNCGRPITSATLTPEGYEEQLIP